MPPTRRGSKALVAGSVDVAGGLDSEGSFRDEWCQRAQRVREEDVGLEMEVS